MTGQTLDLFVRNKESNGGCVRLKATISCGGVKSLWAKPQGVGRFLYREHSCDSARDVVFCIQPLPKGR
jgi:hypothetical protein